MKSEERKLTPMYSNIDGFYFHLTKCLAQLVSITKRSFHQKSTFIEES